MTRKEIKQTCELAKMVKKAPFILEIVDANSTTSKGDEYWIRLKGNNGEIIMAGEMTTLANCEKMAAKLAGHGFKFKLKYCAA